MSTEETKMDVDKEEDESDVELTGMEMEETDEVVEKGSSDDNPEDYVGVTAAADVNVEDEELLATEEAQEMEEAHKERMELMAAEQKLAVEDHQPTNAQERLDYLLAQSDVFAHFLAGKRMQAYCVSLGVRELTPLPLCGLRV